MKNITAFMFLVIIIFAFIAVNSAYSQNDEERGYMFSIAPQTGFIYGQALEYVYPTNTKGELLSELRWDMKSVFYLGLQLDFGKKDVMNGAGFFSSLSFKAGIPGDTGFIEDRDWQSTTSADLTDFSRHTNKTRQFLSLDFAAGASFPVKSWFYVKPFISGSWNRFSFTGRDGYGKYSPPDPPYYPYTGDVISYKQDWLLLSFGVSVGTKILSPFSIDLSFQISPLTYCAGIDEHFTTNTTYMDFTRFGLFLEPALSLSFSHNRIEHSLGFSYRYISRTKGNSYENKKNNGFVDYPYKTGAGLSIMDLRYLLKIHL